jgi:hypothetical protein
MATLPKHLLENLPVPERQSVQNWWDGLSDGSRAELVVLLDARADSCAFGFECGEWQALPLTVDTALLADPIEADADWDLDLDYLEYILINPERFPLHMYQDRIFFIGGVARRQAGFSVQRGSFP